MPKKTTAKSKKVKLLDLPVKSGKGGQDASVKGGTRINKLQ